MASNPHEHNQGNEFGQRLEDFQNHPGVQQLLFGIRSEKEGGNNFNTKLATLGSMMANYWLGRYGQIEQRLVSAPYGEIVQPMIINPPIVISIPRGGTPIGDGVNLIIPTAPHFKTNDGANKDTQRPLLSDDFPVGEQISHVLICDTVVGTGETLHKTIHTISGMISVENFFLLTAVASEEGVRSLLNEHGNLHVYAACVEPKYEWVDVDGKKVFFVHGIGDAGSLVEGSR